MILLTISDLSFCILSHQWLLQMPQITLSYLMSQNAEPFINMSSILVKKELENQGGNRNVHTQTKWKHLSRYQNPPIEIRSQNRHLKESTKGRRVELRRNPS